MDYNPLLDVIARLLPASEDEAHAVAPGDAVKLSPVGSITPFDLASLDLSGLAPETEAAPPTPPLAPSTPPTPEAPTPTPPAPLTPEAPALPTPAAAPKGNVRRLGSGKLPVLQPQPQPVRYEDATAPAPKVDVPSKGVGIGIPRAAMSIAAAAPLAERVKLGRDVLQSAIDAAKVPVRDTLGGGHFEGAGPTEEDPVRYINWAALAQEYASEGAEKSTEFDIGTEKTDRDDEGYTISEVIALTTGGSPRGSTFYKDIDQCSRKWWFRYGLGLVLKVDPIWRLLGTLMHRGLSWYWADRCETPPTWHDPDLRALTEELTRLAGREKSHVEGILTGTLQYNAFYGTGNYIPNHVRRSRNTRADREWIPISTEDIYAATIDQIDPLDKLWEDVKAGRRREPTALELACGQANVTIRPDLLIKTLAAPNMVGLVDHKTEGDDWTGGYKKREFKQWVGDDKYSRWFQFEVYLHVLRVVFGPGRTGRVWVQRCRRDAPYRMHRHEVKSRSERYASTVPATLRRLAAKAAVAETLGNENMWLDPSTMQCDSPFPCDFLALCGTPAHRPDLARSVLSNDYLRIPVHTANGLAIAPLPRP